jgi:activating signal cointegrator 1
MKCLSLWQPWASLLVHGTKRVETRGWETKHRGPLLIHAAKQLNYEQGETCHREPFRSALMSLGMLTVGPPTEDLGPLADMVAQQSVLKVVLGAIVGRVNMVECYRTEDVDFDHSGLDVIPDHPVWQYAPGKLRLWHEQKAFGDYGPGRWAWLCTDFEAFAKPIPYWGKQRLFEVPDELVKEASCASAS